MKKIYFTQRLMAYLIDFMIVYLVIFAFTSITTAIVPTSNKIAESEQELLEKYEELLSNPDSVSTKAFLDEQKGNIYNIGRYSILSLVVGAIVNIAYFGAFQFMNKGQTLGKKFVKIKVEAMEDKKYTYVISVLRACLTYSVFTDLAMCLIYLILSPNTFMIPYGIVSIVAFIFNVVTLIMIALRKDGRGLPDFISGTRVVSTK